jgi:hypothetical protein
MMALKWIEDHAPEGTLNARSCAQTHSSKEDPIGTLMMTKITGNLSDIRRHYWEA